MKPARIGIDFGTTNSSIAWVNGSGDVQLARFADMGLPTNSYRSLLYLELVKERAVSKLKSWSGPDGIDHYLSADGSGRLMQSLKSFLSSHSLQTTEVFGRRHKLEWLIARILRDLREKAESQFGVEISSAVVGRPVQFVGAETDDDNRYAEHRLTEAFHMAGFETISFELEPVAAAGYYESTLDRDQLILIGDFGGEQAISLLSASAPRFCEKAERTPISSETPASASRATPSTPKSSGISSRPPSALDRKCVP